MSARASRLPFLVRVWNGRARAFWRAPMFAPDGRDLWRYRREQSRPRR